MTRFVAALNAAYHGWDITRKLYVAFRMVKPGQLQVSVTHTVDLNENPQQQ